MPLVRIDLKEASTERRLRIADSVHEALVEALGIPPDDRFQIVTEHGRNLIYDRSYLGISRSDDIVIVQVTLNAGRSEEKKAAFYRRVADLLHAKAGVRPEDVFISLVEVPKENWSFGNGVAQYAAPATSTAVEKRLSEMGVALNGGTPPVANFVPVRRFGNYLFVSGHTSKHLQGKVGAGVSPDDAYRAAREVAVDMLGTLVASGVSLDRVRLVKLLGMVNSAPDFTDHPAVINGASDFFVSVFENGNGAHARSSIGVAQLPDNAAVEIEALLEVV
jgi:4-oxalocrotonate tautomerase